MIEGIDVSRWQSTTPSLTGLSFLFARATYGAVHDRLYATHIANARAKGLLVGAYHFGVGDVSVPDQVSAFLASAGKVDFYVLDLERNGSHASMTTQQAAAFLIGVRLKGHKIGLYHSDSGFPSLGQDYNWVAKWGSTPPARPYAFWQYQGSPLDRDRFHGDLAALRRLAGVTPTRFRAVISGYTPLYNRPTGARVGAVKAASYTVTRTKANGQWWYRVISRSDGTKAAWAGRWFKPNAHVKVTLP